MTVLAFPGLLPCCRKTVWRLAAIEQLKKDQPEEWNEWNRGELGIDLKERWLHRGFPKMVVPNNHGFSYQK